MKVEDYLSNPAQHIMIYGEPFTGKSTLASTVALLGFRVIWISLDRSIVHLQKLPKEAQERVELIHLPDGMDHPIGYPTIMSMFSGRPVEICYEHGVVGCAFCKQNKKGFTPFQSSKLGIETVVVIDHITQIASSAMNIVIEYAIKAGEKDANAVIWNSNDPDRFRFFKPGLNQYGYLGRYMEAFLDKIQAAPFHIVCISHVVETKQEDGDRRLVPHGGTDKFSRNVTRYFDHVITTEVRTKLHRYNSLTTGDTNLIAGSRTEVDIKQLFKDGERPTLAPFFTGEIVKVPREYGIDAAANVLKFDAAPSGETAQERLTRVRAAREAAKKAEGK